MRLIAANLACLRGGRGVFEALSFTLDSGEALLITGPNGSGKSSLLRLVAGLLRPETGRLALEGGTADLTLPEQSHYLGHLDALKPSLTVAENLGFWARFLGGPVTDLEGALETTGLAALADLPAAYLSAGQRRRLSIARLVAVPRPIWLLDEPAAALDADAQTLLGGLMANHRVGGGIILAATHGPLGLGDAHRLRMGAES